MLPCGGRRPMARYSSSQLGIAVDKFPRVELIHKPTPFRKLERLTAELGGPEIYIKREDLTGLGFGGDDGNLLLDYILGAEIRIQEAQKGKVVKPEQVLAMLGAIAGEVKRGGGR